MLLATEFQVSPIQLLKKINFNSYNGNNNDNNNKILEMPVQIQVILIIHSEKLITKTT